MVHCKTRVKISILLPLQEYKLWGEVVFEPSDQLERQGLLRISTRGHVSISLRIIKVLVGGNVVCFVLVSVPLTLF